MVLGPVSAEDGGVAAGAPWLVLALPLGAPGAPGFVGGDEAEFGHAGGGILEADADALRLGDFAEDADEEGNIAGKEMGTQPGFTELLLDAVEGIDREAQKTERGEADG